MGRIAMKKTEALIKTGRGISKLREIRAFTLAEMLLVVGMLSILMGVGMVSAAQMERSARRAVLDRMAHTLYLSAQRKLIAARMSGVKLASSGDDGIVRLWSTDPDAARKRWLFPKGGFSGHWAIVYDAENFRALDAYYSQNSAAENKYFSAYLDPNQPGADAEAVNRKLEELRSLSARLADGALIGYYGVGYRADAPLSPEIAASGDSATSDSTSGNPAPKDFPTVLPDSRGGGSPSDPFSGPDAPSLDDGESVTKPTLDNNPETLENIGYKLFCWIGYAQTRPIVNAEKLVTTLNCWIPDVPAFNASGVPDGEPISVNFRLRVIGVDSRAEKTFHIRLNPLGADTRLTTAGAYANFIPGAFRRDETRIAVADDGTRNAVSGWRYCYPVILDSLTNDGHGAPLERLDLNQPFRERFPAFLPGEDIALNLEIDVDDGVKEAVFAQLIDSMSTDEKTFYAFPSDGASLAEKCGWLDHYDWFWKVHAPGWDEYPVCNSLFANAKTSAETGVYTARIACGRHLQNLDTALSGVGERLGEFGASVIRAEQIRDIDFTAAANAESSEGVADTDSGAFSAGIVANYRDVYGARPFIPISNDYLTGYDGGGRLVSNLTVNLSGDESAARREKGAGLFGTLSRSATLRNLTLVDPQIVGGDADTGGFLGKSAAPDGFPVPDVTLSGVQLFMTENSYAGKTLDGVLNQWLTGGRRVGGLIGYAAGDVTMTGDAERGPTFAATVVNADALGVPSAPTYAGGLAGYVRGALTLRDACADCYVKANAETPVAEDGAPISAYLGGLAGYCGAGSSFTRCYASGFAVSNARRGRGLPDASGAETDPVTFLETNRQPIAAAGFVPAPADVSDALSLFRLDDPTFVAGTAEKIRPATLRMSAKCAFVERAAIPAANAFYLESAGLLPNEGASAIDADTLAALELPGFAGEAADASPYGFADARLDGLNVSAPALKGQTTRYNDILIPSPAIVEEGTDLDTGETMPSEGDTAPDTGETAPSEGDTDLDTGESAPSEGDTDPDTGETTPSEGDTDPDTGEITPESAQIRIFDADGVLCGVANVPYGQGISGALSDAVPDAVGWDFYAADSPELLLATLPAPAIVEKYEYEDGYLSDGGAKLQVTLWTDESGETSCYLRPIDGDETLFQLFLPDGTPAQVDGESVTITSDADEKTYFGTYYADGETIREITTVTARVTLPDNKPIVTYRRKILVPSYLSDASGRLADAIGYADADTGAVSVGNRILRRTDDERDGTPVTLLDLAGLTENEFASVAVYRELPDGTTVETALKEAVVGLDSLTAPNFDVLARAR